MESTNEIGLTSLPKEILTWIFLILDFPSFFKFRGVCKMLLELSVSEAILREIKIRNNISIHMKHPTCIFTHWMGNVKFQNLKSPKTIDTIFSSSTLEVSSHKNCYGILHLDYVVKDCEFDYTTPENLAVESGDFSLNYSYFDGREIKKYKISEKSQPKFASHENGFFVVDDSALFSNMLYVKFLSTVKQYEKGYSPQAKVSFMIPRRQGFFADQVFCSGSVIAISCTNQDKPKGESVIIFAYFKWDENLSPEYIYCKEYVLNSPPLYVEFIKSGVLCVTLYNGIEIISLDSSDSHFSEKTISVKYKNVTFSRALISGKRLCIVTGNKKSYFIHFLDVENHKTMQAKSEYDIERLECHAVDLEERLEEIHLEKNSLYLQGSKKIYNFNTTDWKIYKDFPIKNDCECIAACGRLFDHPRDLFLFQGCEFSKKDTIFRNFYWSTKKRGLSELGKFQAESTLR